MSNEQILGSRDQGCCLKYARDYGLYTYISNNNSLFPDPLNPYWSKKMISKKMMIIFFGLIAAAGFTACSDSVKAPNYTVIFNANGGTGEMAGQKFAYGESQHLNACTFTRNNFIFAGWAESSNGDVKYADKQNVKNLAQKGSVTLYAKWNIDLLTVSFNGNGETSGAAPAAQTENFGTVIALPGQGSLLKTGYYFAGWNTNAAGTGSNYEAGADYTINSSATLFAKWESLFTLSFNGNGETSGTAPAAQTETPGTVITLPGQGSLMRTGYRFAGWNTNATGTGSNYETGADYAINSSATLFAEWVGHTLSINYENGGGTGSNPESPSSAVYGSDVTMPSNPYTRTGFNFSGWEVSGAASIPGTYAAGTIVAVANLSTAIANGNSSITLTAAWTAISGITVSFDRQNGEGTANSIAATYNQPYGLLPSLSRTGYAFGGWWTEINGGGSEATSATIVSTTSSHILYAKWTAFTLSISYANGGSTGNAPASPRMADYGNTVTMPANSYSRPGYTFAGWDVSATGDVYAEGTIVAVAALSPAIATGNTGITLTATWVHSVTFMPNGGVPAPDAVTVNNGGKITEPAAMSRTGYAFDGWYTEAAFINKWNFTAGIVTENIILYAKWLPDSFITITFAQISDAAPSIAGTTIYRSSANGPTTANVTVDNPGQYSSIEWHIPKTDISGSGASFTLDSANAAYNNTGEHFLTLEVIKDNVPYSRTITFTVAN